MVSQYIKYEVSRFTRYEAVNGGAKCRKWGGMTTAANTDRSGKNAECTFRIILGLLVRSLNRMQLYLPNFQVHRHTKHYLHPAVRTPPHEEV